MNNTTNNIKTTPLFRTVKKVIDAADCERLLSIGVHESYYDPISATIAQQLRPDMSIMEIAKVIRDVMNRSFNTSHDIEDESKVFYSPGYTTEDFLGTALEIYENFGELIDLSSGKPEFRTCLKKDTDPLPDADRFFGMTPGEVIDCMFSETQADGTYYDFEPYHDDRGSRLLKYTLRWDETDRDDTKNALEKRLHLIEQAAAGGHISRSMERYLAPLWPDYSFLADLGLVDGEESEDPLLCEDVMDGILTKMELEETLSNVESEAYKRYRNALSNAADKRVGKGLYSYELIQYARRLHRLIELGAPRLIIDNEARNLAQATVYHKYGEVVK